MRRLFFLVLVVMSLGIRVQAEDYKGLYVDSFSRILGNEAAEDSLLSFAQFNHFTTISLYELQVVHQNHSLTGYGTASMLADFIFKARTRFHIQHITAIGENFHFFNDIISVYNRNHSALEKIDGYNFEFEFWSNAMVGDGYYCYYYLTPNQLSCNKTGAYQFFMSELKQIRKLARQDGCVTEVFTGWPDSSQAMAIAANADRVFVHTYVTNPNRAYSYAENRLQMFGRCKDSVPVVMVYSAEDTFMRDWLVTNPMDQVFPEFDSCYRKMGDIGNCSVQGAQWFTYHNLPAKQYGTVTTSVGNTHSDYRFVKEAGELTLKGYVREDLELWLYDITGNVKHRWEIPADSDEAHSFDISDINFEGIYVVSLVGSHTVSQRERLYIR